MSAPVLRTLAACANPHCWRRFPKVVGTAQRCCDEACERQAQACEARDQRLALLARGLDRRTA